MLVPCDVTAGNVSHGTPAVTDFVHSRTSPAGSFPWSRSSFYIQPVAVAQFGRFITSELAPAHFEGDPGLSEGRVGLVLTPAWPQCRRAPQFRCIGGPSASQRGPASRSGTGHLPVASRVIWTRIGRRVGGKAGWGQRVARTPRCDDSELVAAWCFQGARRPHGQRRASPRASEGEWLGRMLLPASPPRVRQLTCLFVVY